MIETVKADCRHDDCVYRARFDGQPMCAYIFREGHARGCSISECDKYRTGHKKCVIKSELGFTVEVCDDV